MSRSKTNRPKTSKQVTNTAKSNKNNKNMRKQTNKEHKQTNKQAKTANKWQRTVQQAESKETCFNYLPPTKKAKKKALQHAEAKKIAKTKHKQTYKHSKHT